MKLQGKELKDALNSVLADYCDMQYTSMNPHGSAARRLLELAENHEVNMSLEDILRIAINVSVIKTKDSLKK